MQKITVLYLSSTNQVLLHRNMTYKFDTVVKYVEFSKIHCFSEFENKPLKI